MSQSVSSGMKLTKGLDKVSYLPGKLAQSSVSYHACFHDLEDGLETHVYAPLGLRIRGKWSVGGSLPGEARKPSELDFRVPTSGLYIREDVKMTCSSLLLAFVKKTFQDSHSTLVEKLVERAHILESNFANERLKALRNIAPRDRAGHGDIFIAPPPDYEPAPHYTSHSRSKSAGDILFRPAFIPQYTSHARSHSEPPFLTPDSSCSSSISEESNLESSPRRPDRPVTFTFTFDEESLPSPTTTPEGDLFLLPASTYNGNAKQNEEYDDDEDDDDNNNNRSSSSHSTTWQDPKPDRMISLYPQSPRSRQERRRVSLYPGYPPYKVEKRPFVFNFPFEQKPMSSSAPEQSLLAEIDAAIDDVFSYNLPTSSVDSLPPTTYNADLPATTYQPTLSAKEYKASLPTSNYTLPASTPTSTPDTILLPASTYTPKQQRWTDRKDSVMPHPMYDDDDDYKEEGEQVPPVPPKDKKYKAVFELRV